MLNKDIFKTIKELGDLLHPKALTKLESHLTSLLRQIEQLRESRDRWKNNFEFLKSKVKE